MVDQDTYMETIQSFLEDENKVVTYKYLSNTLSVHVNQAKQMLYTYSKECHSDRLSVCYLVAGLFKNGCYKVLVTPGESLDDVKSSFVSVASCHVYSVQYCKLGNSNTLYMTDYETMKENMATSNIHSSVRCKLAVPSSTEDARPLQYVGDQSSTEIKPVNKAGAPQPASKTASSLKAGPKGGIGAMFANMKKPETQKPKEENTSKVESKPVAKQAVKPFFGQALNKKTASQEVKKQVKSHVKKTSPPQKENKKLLSKKKKSVDSQEDSLPKKKRKRIQAPSDNSSSDEDMETGQREMSPPREGTPPPAEDVEPSVVQVQKRLEAQDKKGSNAAPTDMLVKTRNRHRKQVTKTCVNEDGYMVTEKAWEMCSTDGSDVEIETPAKINPQMSQKSKITAKTIPAKKPQNKQSSLTNFFSKK